MDSPTGRNGSSADPLSWNANPTRTQRLATRAGNRRLVLAEHPHGATRGPDGPGGDLDADPVAPVRRALLDNKAIFFRGQHHLDDDRQQAFAALLGELTKRRPTVRNRAIGAILPIDAEYGKANSWHTDVTFADRVPAISVLRAVVLPTYGGSTPTTHCPTRLKALVDGLWAVHTNLYDYAATADQSGVGGVDVKVQAHRDEFRSDVYETEHPAVRGHPETGERAPLPGHVVNRLVGLSIVESQILFDLPQDRVTKLENTVRRYWEPGDVAIWDNRAPSTTHSPPTTIGHGVCRVTVAGDVTVGVDGVRSTPREGDATHYPDIH